MRMQKSYDVPFRSTMNMFLFQKVQKTDFCTKKKNIYTTQWFASETKELGPTCQAVTESNFSRYMFFLGSRQKDQKFIAMNLLCETKKRKRKKIKTKEKKQRKEQLKSVKRHHGMFWEVTALKTCSLGRCPTRNLEDPELQAGIEEMGMSLKSEKSVSLCSGLPGM